MSIDKLIGASLLLAMLSLSALIIAVIVKFAICGCCP